MNKESQGNTHVNHGKFAKGEFNHSIAGIEHLLVLAKKKINKIAQDIRHCDRQIAAIVREFQKLADIHEVWYQSVSGYESATYRVESQMETKNHYLYGMIASMIIAIVFGVFFSVTTMIASSFLLLFCASVVVAVVIGIVVSVILRAAFGASAVNPLAIIRINIVLVISGSIFLLLLAFFGWLRFQSISPLAIYLPHTMVGLELMAIIFSGACECGYRMYRWSGVLSKRHHQLLNQKETLEEQLSDEYVTLKGLEHRLNGQQFIPIIRDDVNHETDHPLLLKGQKQNGNHENQQNNHSHNHRGYPTGEYNGN